MERVLDWIDPTRMVNYCTPNITYTAKEVQEAIDYYMMVQTAGTTLVVRTYHIVTNISCI